MDEIISLVVANGIFAVLFCGLLVYELRDSREREGRYAKTIEQLSDRLKAVDDIRTAAEKIKTDLADVRTDIAKLLSDADTVKRAVVRPTKKHSGGSGECASAAV